MHIKAHLSNVKVFERNGVTIEYSAGYRCFQDFCTVVRLNYEEIKRGGTTGRFAYLLPQYERTLQAIALATA